MMVGKKNIKDHIVICNWSKKSETIVKQIHDKSISNPPPILVVTDNPNKLPNADNPIYNEMMAIKGDPIKKEVLESADIDKAKSVVILLDEEKEEPDSRSILIALAVESINPSVHVVVELASSDNKLYFQYTHVNEIICLEQLAEKLLAQTSLTPGLSRVYMNLLTQSADTNEIYQEEVPEKFIGYSYREVEKEIIGINRKDIILIGFSTIEKKEAVNGHGNHISYRKIIINPKSSDNSKYSKEYKMKADDTIFLISYTEPKLNIYFTKEEN